MARIRDRASPSERAINTVGPTPSVHPCSRSSPICNRGPVRDFRAEVVSGTNSIRLKCPDRILPHTASAVREESAFAETAVRRSPGVRGADRRENTTVGRRSRSKVKPPQKVVAAKLIIGCPYLSYIETGLSLELAVAAVRRRRSRASNKYEPDRTPTSPYARELP